MRMFGFITMAFLAVFLCGTLFVACSSSGGDDDDDDDDNHGGCGDDCIDFCTNWENCYPSTFYSHYNDIYGCVDRCEETLNDSGEYQHEVMQCYLRECCTDWSCEDVFNCHRDCDDLYRDK